VDRNSRPPEIPPSATPIDTDELLTTIGELYVQVRVMRRIIAQLQHQAETNHAVQVER
jgi:hypothetical protein